MNLNVDISLARPNFNFAAQFYLCDDRIGVFGHSGSGKTTLMHLLAGLLTPDQGQIKIDDTILFDSRKRINLPPEKRRLGLVFQQSLLFPHLDVENNLLYGWKRTAPSHQNIRPDDIIAALHLAPLLKRRPENLSGGEKQRVALGRSILANPRLILLDEPLSGLDDDLKCQIIPYLQKVVTDFKLPLLFTSHSRREMVMMTREVLIFSEGKLCDHLPVSCLPSAPNIINYSS